MKSVQTNIHGPHVNVHCCRLHEVPIAMLLAGDEADADTPSQTGTILLHTISRTKI